MSCPYSIDLLQRKNTMKKALAFIAALWMFWSAAAAALAGPFDDDGSILRLVNREHKVTKKYVPEMVKPKVPTNKKDQAESIYMRPEAAKALEQMFAAAEKKGHHLLAVSGYRSYFTQQANYNRKVKNYGKNQTTVAPAGTSEHQLGLAMDLVCTSYRYLNTEPLKKTKEFQWLYRNCHQYGFILRYTKEWKKITGFSAEGWHFRYLGVAHAAAVTWLNLPYETYVEYARDLPEYVIRQGNAYLLSGLIRDRMEGTGEKYQKIKTLKAQTEIQQQDNIREMTKLFLPKGVALEDALGGKVK